MGARCIWQPHCGPAGCAPDDAVPPRKRPLRPCPSLPVVSPPRSLSLSLAQCRTPSAALRLSPSPLSALSLSLSCTLASPLPPSLPLVPLRSRPPLLRPLHALACVSPPPPPQRPWFGLCVSPLFVPPAHRLCVAALWTCLDLSAPSCLRSAAASRFSGHSAGGCLDSWRTDQVLGMAALHSP